MTGRADGLLRGLTGYQLRRATSASMPGVNRVLAEFGLRRSTYSSLAVIVANPGLNQVQLAEALAIEQPNVVQIVDQLEQAKLVRRTKSVEDRRAYALQATPKGCTLQGRATAALEDYDKVITRGLTEQEITLLLRSLRRIESNAEAAEHHDA